MGDTDFKAEREGLGPSKTSYISLVGVEHRTNKTHLTTIPVTVAMIGVKHSLQLYNSLKRLRQQFPLRLTCSLLVMTRSSLFLQMPSSILMSLHQHEDKKVLSPHHIICFTVHAVMYSARARASGSCGLHDGMSGGARKNRSIRVVFTDQ